VEKASWATLRLLDGHSEERPSSTQPITLEDAIELALNKPLWRQWQQAELRTDGACRIMMMMMTYNYLDINNLAHSRSNISIQMPAYRAN